MKIRRRYAFVVSALAMATVLWFRSPISAEELGIDFWHISELESQIARHEQRCREIDLNGQHTMNRIRTREQILRNLVNQQITFHEAANGFLALNQQEPSAISYLRAKWPGGTDLDRAYGQVYIQLRSMDEPAMQDCAKNLLCEMIVLRPYIDV